MPRTRKRRNLPPAVNSLFLLSAPISAQQLGPLNNTNGLEKLCVINLFVRVPRAPSCQYLASWLTGEGGGGDRGVLLASVIAKRGSGAGGTVVLS